MSKRPNQDSQQESEPAAKRVANQNENEINIVADQKLQAARTALHRLDYKKAHQICTELIDSGCCDPSAPLTLRSLNSEKQGYLASSLEDAKRALKLKESKKTHLRCSFAYLAHALHHLECAREQPEDEQEGDYYVSKSRIKSLSNRIRGFKSLEAGDPFKRRVSEDLLLQMASFFDSPSLSIFSATSKSLRTAVHGSKELFRVFKMSGKGENLTAGINYFSQRCGNSMRSLDIELKNKLSSEDQGLLQSAISLSASTLKEISICHQGDLCKLIIQVASMSPSLKFLSSTNAAGGLSPLNGVSMKVPPSWNLKLIKFFWNGGGESLICDDTLLKSLQTAEEILLFSYDVRPSWVLDLLSSASSTLVSFDIPTTNQEAVDEIPSTIALPKLVNLRLCYIPQSRSTQGSFFNSLHAPNLRSLCLQEINIKDLSSIPQGPSLKEFQTFDLVKPDGTLASEAGEEEATSFVQAIKDWKQVRTLNLMLAGSGFSSFYTHLVDLLTPLSQKNVESGLGLGDRFLLPDLGQITLGERNVPATATFISGEKLAAFVGTRLALWKGFSSDQISSIAAGDLSPVDQEPQGNPFVPLGTYSRITGLEVNIPVEADDETFSWLEENVSLLQRVA